MALAYFYALDSLINTVYTAAFAVGWLMVLMDDDSSSKAPGGKTISDTAGFNDPVVPNASWVEIAPPGHTPGTVPIVLPDDGENSVMVATGVGAEAGLSDVLLHSSGLASMMIIGTLLAIRLYFIIILFSFARQVLRAHLYYLRYGSPSSSPSPRHRFASSTPEITITDGYNSSGGSSSAEVFASDRHSPSRSGSSKATSSASASNTPSDEFSSSQKFRFSSSNNMHNYNNGSSSSRSSPPTPPSYNHQPSAHNLTSQHELQQEQGQSLINPSFSSPPSSSSVRSTNRNWSTKLGKTMIALGRTYWLGDVNRPSNSNNSAVTDDEDIEWMHVTNRRLAARRAAPGGSYYTDSAAGSGAGAAVGRHDNGRPSGGVGERERRRRSGTGPPPPQSQPLAPPFRGSRQQQQQQQQQQHGMQSVELEDFASAGSASGSASFAAAGAGGAGAGAGGPSVSFGHDR